MNAPLDSLTGAALSALWAGLVDASAFALLVYVANAIVRPAAATRHMLWWLVIAIAVAVPVASFSTSLGRVRTISRPLAAAPMKTIAAVHAIASFPGAVRAKHPDNTTMSAAPLAPVPHRLDVAISAAALCGAVLGVWLAIALYANIGIVVELFALRRVKRCAKPLDPTTVSMLRAWVANSNGRRKATIAVSPDVAVPCAAGLWSPAILLPATVIDHACEGDLDRIAMHEYAHLVRFDDWTNLAERIIGGVLWFNPAVALAKRRIAVDREIACDDWVVARTGGAHRYASCLFRLAESARSVSGARPAHALGALGDVRNVTARIEHLLTNAHEPRRFGRTLPLTLSLAALVVVAGQAMRAPAIAVEIAAAAPHSATVPRKPHVDRIIFISDEPKRATDDVAPIRRLIISDPSLPERATVRVVRVTGARRHPSRAARVPDVRIEHHASETVVVAEAARPATAVVSQASATPAVPAVPSIPALPKIPSIPPIPPIPAFHVPQDSEALSDAAARVGRAANRVAQGALESAESGSDAVDRAARERVLREASTELRDAEKRLRDIAISSAMAQARREAEVERNEIRAYTHQTEAIRKAEIENALRSLRSEMEQERP